MNLDQIQGEGRVKAWNEHVPTGTPCVLVNDDGALLDTMTISEAWCLGHGQPVVKCKGKSGLYSLDRVIPKVRDHAELVRVQEQIIDIAICKVEGAASDIRKLVGYPAGPYPEIERTP